MIRWISITALLLAMACPLGTEVQAAPRSNAPTQLTRLNKAFYNLVRLSNERIKLLSRLRRFQSTIRKTRARAAGPARDYKLRRLLAGARALAKRLSASDKQMKAARAELLAARKQLLRTIVRLKKAQQRRARRALAQTARKGRGKLTVLRIAKTRLHPLDGPREINEKADLLKDSAEKIRKRLKEIDQVISRLGKRQKLRRIARGVDRYAGLFGEDTSRRRVTRIRPAKPAGVTGEAPGPGEGPHNANDLDAGYTNNPSSSLSDDGVSRGGTSSSTYAVVLKELLTPTTLAALRKAGRSADPRVRMAALKKARAELKKAIAKLKKRALRYRTKAQNLKTRERRRRR